MLSFKTWLSEGRGVPPFNRLSRGTPLSLYSDSQVLKDGTSFIRLLYNRKMSKEFDFKSMRAPLLTINKKIKSMCNHALELAVYTDIPSDIQSISLYDDSAVNDFVVCLNSNKRCISSISCKINDDLSVEFSSKTNPAFEGRKYNLLMRAALFLLAPTIKIKKNGTYQRLGNFISRAIHPVSIYLLAKYFHARNERLDAYMEENQLSYSTLTVDDAKDFFYNDGIDENLEDAEEMDKYMWMNEDFGSPIVFTLDIHDANVRNQAKRIFQTTLIRCPDPIFTKTAKTPKTKRIISPSENKSRKRRAV